MNVWSRVVSGWLIAGMMSASGHASTLATAPGLRAVGDTTADTTQSLVCANAPGVRLEMRVMTRHDSVYTPNRFVVTLGKGQYQEVVTGQYLLLTGKPGALPNCGVFVTQSSGVLPLTIQVRDGTGSTESFRHPQAAVHFDLPLKPSWVWGVLLVVSPSGERDDLPRFGPPVQYASTVALPEGDSLFVRVIGYDPVEAAHTVY